MDSEHSTKFWHAVKLGWIARHLSQPWELGLYVFCNGFLSVAILALAAWMSGSPLVFPSLGPTAYLLFLFPLSAAASPRNCLLGMRLELRAATARCWSRGWRAYLTPMPIR